MDRFDRIFALHQLLSSSRQPVSRQQIEQALECSRATAKRIIENMRDYLNAPIEYDRERNGYYYARNSDYGEMYELPGVWFNASELHALLSVQQLLQEVQPGLLERQLAPLREHIDRLLAAQQPEGEPIGRRIRILRAAARPPGPCFQTIADALARRRRLQVRYFKRGESATSERELSPQRLVHYRDNWYLEAWCHLRDDLRTFALDSIERATIQEAAAREVAEEELERHGSGAYGIFSGAAAHTAVLRFRPQRARWVAAEQWHPRQQSRWLEDGRYELHVPYGQTPELVMDILKYGPDVEVVAPEELRRQVARRLQEAVALYRQA
ncbi:MAG TPA: WYL domain-containing protein [Sedimenticola thiotaurini]|uniref:WYL domain-containing protein n=1 Tax=Sedimenticola thiotaurini TaxID=1543721 RepID=A0A831RK09_9GAMM|nr:WYL domain-containing protein [Sedimenticola thiotaurini]